MVVHLKVLLPYASAGYFTLFSIDKHVSFVSVFDPLSVLPSPKSKMRRSHNMQLKLQKTGIYLSETLGLAQPGWDGDIFSWPRKSPVCIPESLDRWMSLKINSCGLFAFLLFNNDITMSHSSTAMRRDILSFTLYSHGMVKNWFIQYARWVFYLVYIYTCHINDSG